eukprot:CFRG1030T1
MVASQHTNAMTAGILKNMEAITQAPLKGTPPPRPVAPTKKVMECIQMPTEQPTKETVENDTAAPTQEPARVKVQEKTMIAPSPGPVRPPLPKNLDILAAKWASDESFKTQSNASTSEQKMSDVEVPTYRFITSMQGHGYPVTPSVIARTQRKSPELVETPAVTHSKLAVAKPIHRQVPKYRFISSMAGHYGFPHTIGVKANPKPHKASIFATVSMRTKHLVHSILPKSKAKKEGTVPSTQRLIEIPAYRFISTMQGHGYPITCNAQAPVHTTSVAAKAQSKPIVHTAKAKPIVPAYRFITTMAGYGFPHTHEFTMQVPKEKKTLIDTMMGSATHFVNSLMYKPSSKVATQVPPKKKGGAAVLASPILAHVPEYRFITSMQGYGYPVQAISTTLAAAAVIPPKRKSIIQVLMDKLKSDPAPQKRIESLPTTPVPAHRFITTMQGYGYPHVNIPPAKPVAPPRPEGHPINFKRSIDNLFDERKREQENTAAQSKTPTDTPSQHTGIGFIKFWKKFTIKSSKSGNGSAKSSKESLSETGNQGKRK